MVDRFLGLAHRILGLVLPIDAGGAGFRGSHLESAAIDSQTLEDILRDTYLFFISRLTIFSPFSLVHPQPWEDARCHGF